MPPVGPGVVARSAAAALAISSLCVAQGVPPTPASNWLIVAEGSLRLELVRQGGCGGVLSLDATRRVVRWEAAPDPAACADGFEAPFGDVAGVTTLREGGFAVQFEGQQRGALVLVPLPHAAVFAGQTPGSTPGAASPASAASGAPVAIADPLVADSRRAVERILAVLGRPAPARVALKEALYGPPLETTVEELLETPAVYVGRAVRLRSRFQAATGAAGHQLVAGERSLAIAPEADLAAFVQSKAASWSGREVELVGVFWSVGSSAAASSSARVSFWECAPADAPAGTAAAGERTDLAPLLANPEAAAGKAVRVIGRFRGRNLYGDLPPSSRLGGDWVIKDGPHALWVIGKPAGVGFDLDPGAPSSTSAWVEVVGEAVVREGRLLLRAQTLAVVPPPPTGHVVPARQTVAEGVPPAIIFTLPLEGEGLAPEGRLVIQFSKPMDEESFAGRVRLSYAGGSGEEAFRIGMRYDDEHRSLVIDPGTPLRVGETLEVRLLPGIVDAHGMALEPRAGRQVGAAVDALRYPVEDP